MLLVLFPRGEADVEVSRVQVSAQEEKQNLSKLRSLYSNETEAEDPIRSCVSHYILSVPIHRWLGNLKLCWVPHRSPAAATQGKEMVKPGGQSHVWEGEKGTRQFNGRGPLSAAFIPTGLNTFIRICILRDRQENDGWGKEKWEGLAALNAAVAHNLLT